MAKTFEEAAVEAAEAAQAVPDSVFRLVEYEALGHTFRLLMVGNADAKDQVFFLPGFADDQTGFLQLATKLAARGCLCAVSAMPQYDESWPLRREGFGFQDCVAVVHAGVQSLQAQATVNSSSSNNNNNKKAAGNNKSPAAVHLVAHDWGSFIGTAYANDHAENVKTFTSFDIGSAVLAKDPDVTPEAVAAIKAEHPELAPWLPVKLWRGFVQVHYQSWFAFSFMLSRYYITLPLAYVVFYAASLVIFMTPLAYLLCPTEPFERPPPRKISGCPVSPHMAYPYYYLWKAVLTGALKTDPWFKTSPHRFPEGTPHLFLYGKDKNTVFHDARLLAKIDALKEKNKKKKKEKEKEEGVGSYRHRGLPGGHWVWRRNPDECFEEVARHIGVGVKEE